MKHYIQSDWRIPSSLPPPFGMSCPLTLANSMHGSATKRRCIGQPQQDAYTLTGRPACLCVRRCAGRNGLRADFSDGTWLCSGGEQGRDIASHISLSRINTTVYCSYSELFVNILLKAILTFSNKLATHILAIPPDKNLTFSSAKLAWYAILLHITSSDRRAAPIWPDQVGQFYVNWLSSPWNSQTLKGGTCDWVITKLTWNNENTSCYI